MSLPLRRFPRTTRFRPAITAHGGRDPRRALLISCRLYGMGYHYIGGVKKKSDGACRAMGAEEAHRGLISHAHKTGIDERTPYADGVVSESLEVMGPEFGDAMSSWPLVETALLVLAAAAFHGLYRGREPRRQMRGFGFVFVAVLVYVTACLLKYEDVYVERAAGLTVGGVFAVGVADAWWSDAAAPPPPAALPGPFDMSASSMSEVGSEPAVPEDVWPGGDAWSAEAMPQK